MVVGGGEVVKDTLPFWDTRSLEILHSSLAVRVRTSPASAIHLLDFQNDAGPTVFSDSPPKPQLGDNHEPNVSASIQLPTCLTHEIVQTFGAERYNSPSCSFFDS